VELGLASRLAFRDLVYTSDRGIPLVGCPAVHRYLEVDQDTIHGIRALQSTATIGEAESRILAETGEEVDLVYLANVLLDRGFIATVDGEEVGADLVKKTPSLLTRVPPERVAFLRNPVFVAAVVGLTAFAMLLLATEPTLRPRREDLFLLDNPLESFLLSFGTLLLLAGLHELSHYFMAWSYGVRSSFSLSHRFYVIVMQTNVTNVWTLPRRQRIAVFLAGIGFNLVVLSAAVVALAVSDAGFHQLSFTQEAVLRWIAYLSWIPVMFQFFVFARTDFYYVLMTLVGERNLTADARAYLRFLAGRLWRSIRSRERRACPHCQRAGIPEDPFCYGCKRPLPVSDPNLYPFTYKSQWRLLVFSVVLFLGTILGTMFFVFFVLSSMPKLLLSGAFVTMYGYRTGHWTQMAEGLLVVAIVGFQGAFMARSMGGKVKGWIVGARKRWQDRRAGKARQQS